MRLGSIRHFIQALSSRPGSLFGHSSFGVFCQSVISLRYPKHPTPCFWVRKVLHDHATLFGARSPCLALSMTWTVTKAIAKVRARQLR